MLFKSVTFLAAISLAAAQRPANTSICDYYTTALLMNNTAANQYALVAQVVNTAVIGNYTSNKTAVAGILAPGNVNGTMVNLAGYFNGGFNSTNRNNMPVSVNFLDDGGAAPLKMNMPANGTSSNQYKLLTHLYEYFGALLGCSMYGMQGYPAYDGGPSQYQVHKYMALDNAQVTYFIQQVGLAAASFGVTTDDVTAVAKALNGAFNLRCSPPTAIIPAQGPQLQAICIDSDCTQDPMNATCSSYEAVQSPAVNNATLAGTSSNGTMTGGSSGGSSTTSSSSTGQTGSNGAGSGSGPSGSGTSGSQGSGSTSSGNGAVSSFTVSSFGVVTAIMGVIAIAMAL